MDKAIKTLLTQEGMRALVLDVRDNPGGLLSGVVDMAGRFIKRGVVVTTKGRSAPEDVYRASQDAAYPDFPMAVLVNHGSASASEILAGALRDHGRATIIGTRTFGKGSVQQLFEIPSLTGKVSRIKLTTQYYYLPKGERIHGRGVAPDVTVELTEEERDALLASQRAVYSARNGPEGTSQPATGTAPAGPRVEIVIDRQLQAAIDALRDELAAREEQAATTLRKAG